MPGDFNARVGKDIDIWNGLIGKPDVRKINTHGLRLLTHRSAHDPTLTNITFQHKHKHTIPSMHPR